MTKCFGSQYFGISVFRYLGISVFRWESNAARNISERRCFLFYGRAGHCLQKAHSLISLTTNKGRDSSGVERMTSNHKAAGSNPARGFCAQYLGSLHFMNFIGMKIKIEVRKLVKPSTTREHLFCAFAQILLRASRLTG